MKKIKLNNKFPSDLYGAIYFAPVEYTKEKGFTLLRQFQTCRGYLGQGLMEIKMKDRIKNYQNIMTSGYGVPSDFRFKSGFTYLAIKFSQAKSNNSIDSYRQTFLKSLAWLHQMEEKAGVKLSEIVATQDPETFVVIGSKYWKDSCWKYMLWSYFIKCMCFKNPKECDSQYWTNKGLLNINPQTGIRYLEQFLKNVKMPHKEEIFDKSVYGLDQRQNSHHYNGFYSICSGTNKPMAKLLGIYNEPI